MTLTITDTTITSNQNPHTARQAPGRPHQWEVSWLPGQAMDRNSAITAMLLAEIAAQGDLREGHRLWPHIQGWAAELGLTGPDAIAQACQPPRGLDPGQERASGQPDMEAGQVASQPDTASRSPGGADLEADPWASGLYAGMNRGDPLPASVVHAIADFALKLPPAPLPSGWPRRWPSPSPRWRPSND
jgi:hypothetical protein